MSQGTKPTNHQLLRKAVELCEADDNEGICHACGETQDGAEQTVLMLG